MERPRAVIGPRGEVIIPASVRDALSLHPDREVFLELTAEGLFIRTKDPNVVGWFRDMARKHGRPTKDIPTADEAYEERFG